MQVPLLVTAVSVTTPGTAVSLDATNAIGPLCGIQLVADVNNANTIYIGDSSVSSTKGIPLNAGGAFSMAGDMRRDGTDEYRLTDFYIDAAAGGDKVQILVFKKG